jgi:hypothetical protein
MVLAGTFVPPGARGATTVYAKLPAFCRVTANAHAVERLPISKPKFGFPQQAGTASFKQSVTAAGRGQFLTHSDRCRGCWRLCRRGNRHRPHRWLIADFALGHPEKLVDFARSIDSRDDSAGEIDH